MTGTDEELPGLLTDVFACNRVWSAWGTGAMTEEDFIPAAEDSDVTGDLIAWRDAAVAAGSKRALISLREQIVRDIAIEQQLGDDYSESNGDLSWDQANQHWGKAEALREVLATMDRMEAGQ